MGAGPDRGETDGRGVWMLVRTMEVGLRELQRRTSEVMARVEQEGLRVIVSRHGLPIAVLVPIGEAHVWALQNHSLSDQSADEEAFWPIENGVRVAPGAVEPLAALRDSVRRRLLVRLRRLRGFDAAGRIVIRAGQLWALADLSVDDVPTVLRVARKAELRRWFLAAARGDQPM